MGGGILLLEYESLYHLLSQIYPSFPWEKDKFAANQNKINYFIEWLKKQNPREISLVCQFVKNKEFSSLFQTAFPLQWRQKKSQYILKECIEKVFANALVLEEYRHPDANLELDYFLPEFKLAFEYQVYKLDMSIVAEF